MEMIYVFTELYSKSCLKYNKDGKQMKYKLVNLGDDTISFDEQTQTLREIRSNFMKVIDVAVENQEKSARAESEGSGDVRHSLNINGKDIDYLSDILDITEHRQFMSEIDTKPKTKFVKASNGDRIVPIENKLVYTDFNKVDPGISKIVVFNTEDYSEIDAMSSLLLEAEKGVYDYEQAWRNAKIICGEEALNEYNNSMFGNAYRYERQFERGKSRSDNYHSEKQRFRTDIHFENEKEKSNIRHSLAIDTHMDTEGRKLSEAQQEFFKDEHVVFTDAGFLKVYFHGSDNLGFTSIDTAMSDDGISFFLTDNKNVAA